MRHIAESDWKKFRRVNEVALQRYCERVLAELQKITSDNSKSAYERYLEIFRLIDERNESMAHMFDDPRRSNADLQLALMHSHKLLTSEEIDTFSEEIKSSLRSQRSSI